MATMRYFVSDVEEAIASYTGKLGFRWNNISDFLQSLPEGTSSFGSATLELQRLGR